MKILLEVRHPAHVHHFRNFISVMASKGHEVLVLAVKKDLAILLLDNYGFQYRCIGVNRKGIFPKLISLFGQIINVMKICREWNPDLLIGRPSPTITFSGFLLRKKRIIFAEDDFKAVFWGNLISYPFAREVVTPLVTDIGWFSKKKIGYNGYQKLAYLHPRLFKPDKEKITKSIDLSKPYFILRFSKLTAYHDMGCRGIYDGVANRIIKILIPHGNIYITSERNLDSHLEKYRIKIDPVDIHHALAFAHLFIGDSQTMTAEAAILGTPALRFNDFVGKLGYLEELEHKYGLTYGFQTNQPDKLYAKIVELLNTPNLKQAWQTKRQRMLKDKIDVTAFMVWLIEHYPESVRKMRENPDYQYRFR